MKARNLENGLAVLGALVVLLGVSAAAGTALAADAELVTTTAVAVHDAGEVARETAAEAQNETAERAIRVLELSNTIELEISIDDRTSLLMADAQ